MNRAKLAVILGAGASYDVCPDVLQIKNEDLRPPVVASLLLSHRFNNILKTYPPANALMSSFRVEQRRPNGSTFEQFLRAQEEDPHPNIQRQLRFIPLALHDFFLAVSEEYTSEAVNYSYLVNEILRRDIPVGFITVNYDNLLEKSLSTITGVSFDTIESYVGDPHWKLIKLHGSVGWAYPWFNVDDTGFAGHSLGAQQLERPQADAGSIHVGFTRELTNGRQFYYPAMALPVAGKYDFVCPPSHVQAFREFLPDCENFLFIGFSANDQDLLVFLRENVRNVRRLRIVTGRNDVGESDLQEVSSRLLSGVPKFKGQLPGYYYNQNRDGFDNGFTAFVQTDFIPFVESLSTD